MAMATIFYPWKIASKCVATTLLILLKRKSFRYWVSETFSLIHRSITLQISILCCKLGISVSPVFKENDRFLKEDICSLPPVTPSASNCVAFIPSWTFNSTSGHCESYIYGCIFQFFIW